jgi:hypothetical protein
LAHHRNDSYHHSSFLCRPRQIPLLDCTQLHQAILTSSQKKPKCNVGIGRLIPHHTNALCFPWTVVAILAGGIRGFYGNIQLHKIKE